MRIKARNSKTQATFYLDLEKPLATPGLTRKLELLIKKNVYILELNLLSAMNVISHERNALKRHVDILHKGLEPFKCEECGKNFGAKCALERHVDVIHKGLKAF